MERVIFDVPGKPQGKGRPRASVVGGHARMYTPAGTASYENKIMLCYQQRHAGVRFAPPIVLEVDAYFAIPKSYPKKKAALCNQNILRPTCKPDMDNIAKTVADALNGVAYRDDSAIVELRVAKRYGSPERLVVRVGEYVQAQNDRQEEDFKKQAILLDGLYRQWISTQQKKPRVLNLKELYPSLFGKKSPRHMTPEERRAAEIEAWTKFLMG